MRLPFRREKDQGPKPAQLAVNLYFSYVTSSEKLAELTKRSAAGEDPAEIRREALHRARQAAYLNHAAFKGVMYLGLQEELPDRWLPIQALGAFARVIYGLVALTEDPPPAEAVLSAEEQASLADQYDLDRWLHFWDDETARLGIDLDQALPDAPPDLPRIKPTSRDILRLREQLLDGSDVDPELVPDARFLVARQEAAAGLLIDHAELLELVHDRYAENGPSPDLETIALEAAGNFAVVLQSLRRRQDLLNLLILDPEAPAVPVALMDQILFSFLLLSGPRNERYLKSLLSTSDVEGFMRSLAVQGWMERLDPRELFDEPPGPRLGLSAPAES
jgi:hypothetical protein